ncbi:unnamed protein product [Schistosoma turkestanicum]|nr:unnamed protein product [Schistosoma turkestanicum]
MSREGEAEIPEMGEGGRVVLVYESINLDTNLTMDLNKSSNDNQSTMLSKKCRLVTKGTPEKLIEHLIADLSNVDNSYPEDFLLTYRTFLDSPRPIIDRLFSWHLHHAKLRSRVNRIILLWVHNHFNDFEDNHEMMKYIEQFDNMLSSDGTAGERRLFRLACSTKARPREVELIIPLKTVRHLNSDNNTKQIVDDSAALSTSSTGGQQQHLNNSVIDPLLPFTMIGGEDGFGLFIHEVHNLVANNNSVTTAVTYDGLTTTNQKCLTNNNNNNTSSSSSLILSSSSSLSCDSGYPSSSTTTTTPTCTLPNYSLVPNQIRRADQLLSVNGRSVEHFKPIDVIQLIHSMINACCSLDNNKKTGLNHKQLTVTGRSLSPTIVHNNTTTIDNSTGGDHSKSSTMTGVTFNLRLLVIFNPVQYYQVLNSMNNTNTNNTTTPILLSNSMKPINKPISTYQTVDDLKNPMKKSSAPLCGNIMLNNSNGNNEICRLKKHSLSKLRRRIRPTSISIPDDLVRNSNDPYLQQQQQQPPTSAVLLLPKMPSPGSFSMLSSSSTPSSSTSPGNNNSLKRHGQHFQSLLTQHVTTSGRSSHSANTSPTRSTYSHEDSQAFFVVGDNDDDDDKTTTAGTTTTTTTTTIGNNKQSVNSPSRWSHSLKDSSNIIIDNNHQHHPCRPGEPHSLNDKLNHSTKTPAQQPLPPPPPPQRSSSQPDLIMLNESFTGVGGSSRSSSSNVTASGAAAAATTTTTSEYSAIRQRTQHHFDYSSLNSSSNNITSHHHHHHLDQLSVIRVWRSSDSGKDHSSKLILLPSKQTSAHEATRLCMEEFNIPEEDQHFYCLYHVTVESGPIVKQSRLANNLDDLAGRLTLNSRYYLKNLHNHDPLIADDVAKTILTESRVTFTQLPPNELATRLTIDDYEIFRSVQSTEYIDEVFGLSNSSNTDTNNISSSVGYATGHENLDRFTELVNREAYWAPTEICNEPSLNRRVDLLKRFIKLAKLCRELRNFNTMFCLLVGLHQTPVGRLKQTWDRLPNKYQKIYRDLSMVLDTSRNFHHYRSLLSADNVSAPMLPYLPLVLKDLTFIHLGNPSCTSDGLINFVKLRMLAKEIRAICRMCNVDYDILLCTTTTTTTPHRSRSAAASHGGGSGGGGGVAGVVGRSRAVKAVTAVSSSINPKLYFSSLTSISNNSNNNNQTNNSHSVGLDSNWSEHDMVEVKFNHSNSFDDSKQTQQQQQHQRENKLNIDVNSIHSASGTNDYNVVESNTNKTTPLKFTNALITDPSTCVASSPASSAAATAVAHNSTTFTKSTDSLTRPILGAQSIEDARKLLALSVGSKRASQRRLPAFTFPNYFHCSNSNSNSNNGGNQSMFMTTSSSSPVGPYAGIGFGQLKSQHNNHNSNSTVLTSSSAFNTACSNHLHPHHHQQQQQQHLSHLHQHQHQPHQSHQHQHTQNRYSTQSTRCYMNASGTIGSKSYLLDNLIPMPSRIITGTTTTNHVVLYNQHHHNHNHNSVTNQMYALLPNQKHQHQPQTQLQHQQQQQQHSLIQHQQISASPPHNRGQSTNNTTATTMKQHYSSQQQQPNHQSLPNYIGSRPASNPNTATALHSSSCRGIPVQHQHHQQQQQQQQQMMTCPYWPSHTSGASGAYPSNQQHQHQNQQATVHSARSRDQSSLLQQQQQQHQHSTSFNSDENYLYPTANTVPLGGGGGGGGGPLLSIPRNYRQSTIQRIIPQSLKYPQNVNVQQQQQRVGVVHQSLKNDLINNNNNNTRYESQNNTTTATTNNHRIPNNLSSGMMKQTPVGHISTVPTHTAQASNTKLDNKQLLHVKQLSDRNSQNPINYVTPSPLTVMTTTTSTAAAAAPPPTTMVSSRSEVNHHNSNHTNSHLHYRPSERNKFTTGCQSSQQQQRVQQERPTPPSYQQVLSMARQGGNNNNSQGSLKIIPAHQSHSRNNDMIYSLNERSQPPAAATQRTITTTLSSSNCNHNHNYRASSCSPGMSSIVRPIGNDLNTVATVEPRQKHTGRKKQIVSNHTTFYHYHQSTRVTHTNTI